MSRTALAVACSLAVAVALLGPARRARAQSCCSLVSEDELSVVPPGHRAVIGSRLAAKQMLFQHDREGHSHALGDDVSASDVILSVGAGLRMPFYDRLQLHATLPVRGQLRTQGRQPLHQLAQKAFLGRQQVDTVVAAASLAV